MTRPTTSSSAACRRIIAVLAAHPEGIRRRDLIAIAGVSTDHAATLLWVLGNEGKAILLGWGSGALWCLPEHVERAKAAQEVRRRNARRNSEARRRAKLQARSMQEIDEDGADSSPFVRRSVKAAECEPVRTRAAVSVWAYAQEVA